MEPSWKQYKLNIANSAVIFLTNIFWTLFILQILQIAISDNLFLLIVVVDKYWKLLFNSFTYIVIPYNVMEIVTLFLSDPSPIIGYACHSLTDSLTHSCLVNLIDVTLACEDAYSKLVEVVTVADVSDEDRVVNSLLKIWKLRFGQKAELLFRLWAQGLVKILKLEV